MFFSILAIFAALAGPLPARRVAYEAAPGVWRIKDTAQSGKPLRHIIPTSYQTGNIQWNVFFPDPAGQGFNDATLGGDRKAVVMRVLTTISQALAYSTGTLDILLMQKPSNIDADFLALGSTNFPDPQSTPTGFYGGDLFTHLNSRVDPDPNDVDFFCYVNFDYPWYTGTDQPASTQYDLASALLHELTHGMGMVSLLQADGKSALSQTNPGIYTTWDRLLGLSGGTGLFEMNGVFTGSPGDLQGSGNPAGVFFLGLEAIAYHGGSPPAVYTPYQFESDRSLSHWAAGTGGDSVMEPDIAAGVAKRAYTQMDLAVLADLGWKVQLPNAATGGWNKYE